MSVAYPQPWPGSQLGAVLGIVLVQLLSMDLMMLQQALPARRGLFYLLFKGLGRIVEYSFQPGFGQAEFNIPDLKTTPTFEASEKAFESMWEAADPTFRCTMDCLVIVLLLTILYLVTKLFVMIRQVGHSVAQSSGDVARASLRSSVELFGYTSGVVRRSFCGASFAELEKSDNVPEGSKTNHPTDVKEKQTWEAFNGSRVAGTYPPGVDHLPSSYFSPKATTIIQEISTEILEESLALPSQAGNAMQPVCCTCGQPGVANSMLEATLCGAKVHMRCKAKHRESCLFVCDLGGPVDASWTQRFRLCRPVQALLWLWLRR